MAFNSDTFHFRAGTPDAVKEAILAAYMVGRRVRIFYGDPETGKPTLDDWNVIGTIKRSTGSLKVPLIVHNRRSLGGDEIRTDRLLRIVCTKTKQDLYRADNYQVPNLEIGEDSTPSNDLFFNVSRDGELYGAFYTREEAENWIAWHKGERMRPT